MEDMCSVHAGPVVGIGRDVDVESGLEGFKRRVLVCIWYILLGIKFNMSVLVFAVWYEGTYPRSHQVK